jgi:hypothetical protein
MGRLSSKTPKSIDTTESLSLPLWGMDHEKYSLHWILTQPFNNKLTFQRDNIDTISGLNNAQFTSSDAGLSLSLTHQFTALATAEPMTLILHLSGADPLAGARRCRKYLIEKGCFETLQQKLVSLPHGNRLLGASHIYLWGSGPLAVKDIHSWSLLLKHLQADTPFSQTIRNHLEKEEVKQLLYTSPSSLLSWQKGLIIRALNEALNNWVREDWQQPESNLQGLVSRYAELRQQLQQHCGSALTPDASLWGSGISINTFQQFKAANLEKIWFGLGDGWQGGVWHPEAVRYGVAAGYLVAPYDSYETALPAGQECAWTTAHLGETINHKCAVMKANGTLKSGFQQKGHYTNPRSVRPFLQQRIQKLWQAIGFNSWFLDAYAFGMVFDDYRPGVGMPQSQMADEYCNSMEWVGKELKLLVGSECGNAVTTRGVLFAHGMQTTVIGWGQDDLYKNSDSSYYLGGWYPDNQPTLFFKSTPINDFFKTVHFDPRYRLPLYQAVFHDALVTSHHWLFDNLKLSNVRAENELTQLLYNVAPFYHITHIPHL